MSNFAVEALNIERNFNGGEVRALDDVSLHVPQGEVFGLLGPNGSGKTTMVRILSTILLPTSGTATVNGFDVVKQPDAVRRSIGLAGQYATVDENLTGSENLRMIGLPEPPRKVHWWSFLRSKDLLEQFGLSDAANRTTKTYSGGMRRRLDLAAALVASPTAALPRRTNDRSRSPESPGPLGHHRRARRGWHHGAAHDAVPRRS
jgi:ABC-2 type transport system ATP-binding protein